eukprot:755006-Pyramimonas_sp.AAC.1
MVPVMQMFREYDKLGGDDWEHQQQIEEAAALRSGIAGYRMAATTQTIQFFCPTGLLAWEKSHVVQG